MTYNIDDTYIGFLGNCLIIFIVVKVGSDILAKIIFSSTGRFKYILYADILNCVDFNWDNFIYLKDFYDAE